MTQPLLTFLFSLHTSLGAYLYFTSLHTSRSWSLDSVFNACVACLHQSMGLMHCSRDPQTSFFSKIFIKNWFHGTIHTFKNSQNTIAHAWHLTPRHLATNPMTQPLLTFFLSLHTSLGAYLYFTSLHTSRSWSLDSIFNACVACLHLSVGHVHCSRDPQTSFFIKIFIKTWSHGTIHIFKNSQNTIAHTWHLTPRHLATNPMTQPLLTFFFSLHTSLGAYLYFTSLHTSRSWSLDSVCIGQWVSCTVHETHKPLFSSKFSLKLGPTALFTYLKTHKIQLHTLDTKLLTLWHNHSWLSFFHFTLVLMLTRTSPHFTRLGLGVWIAVSILVLCVCVCQWAPCTVHGTYKPLFSGKFSLRVRLFWV